MPTSPHWEVTNSPKIFAFWNYILPGGSRVCSYEAYWKSGLPEMTGSPLVFYSSPSH